MPSLSLAAGRGVALQSGLYHIGPAVLPPALRQHYNQLSHQTPFPVDQYSGRKSSTLTDIISGGFEGVKKLWKTASNMREILAYAAYSRQLKKHFEDNKAPYEIQRYVFNANGRDRLPSPKSLARKEGGPVSIVKEANQAYEYSGITFDFFKEQLGFVLPQPLIQVVNYNDNPLMLGYGNAFFSPLQFGLQMMVYGTGDGKIFHSFTRDLTVIAHELGHAYTDSVFAGKFENPGQPGAINEHISDVLAKSVEAKHRGWDGLVGNWKIGADLMVNPDFALRSMSYPGQAYDDKSLGKDPQVAHMRDYVVTAGDDGGVHTNSGILNRVFALFCEQIEGPIYDVPLQIWIQAMGHVKANPSFKEFGQALLDVAVAENLGRPMLNALNEVGILDYEVRGQQVERIASLSNEGMLLSEATDTKIKIA